MTLRWSGEASGSAAGDRLLNVGHAAVHLSTGDLVQIEYDPTVSAPNQLALKVVTSHTTPTVIGYVSTDIFNLTGVPRSVALARDASDNLYVVGRWAGSSTSYLAAQAWRKGAGLTWTAQPAVHKKSGSVTNGLTLSGFAAVWCNTGGGRGGAGHLMVIVNCTGGQQVAIGWDAGNLLASIPAEFSSAALNPSFLGSSVAAVAGSNLDLVTDGFGAVSGLAISATTATQVRVAAWGLTAQGTLTAGGGVNVLLTAGTLSATTKVAIRRLDSNLFYAAYRTAALNTLSVAAFSSSAQLTATLAITNTTGNYPASPGSGLSWGATAGPVTSDTLWLYAWSSATATTLLRVSVSPGSDGITPTLGSVQTDTTSVGNAPATIRTVGQPVDFTHADWQAYNVNGATLSLVGGDSVLPTNPDLPTLLTPASATIDDISASSSVFTWAFNALFQGDTQAAYYLRRQRIDTAGNAYEYWRASDNTWQSTEQRNVSATSSVTFPTGKWTAAASYSWTVDTEGSTGLRSGYALPFYLTVANPGQAAPTLTAVYDATTDRVVLTLTGSSGVPNGSIDYSDDGGSTWNTLRGASALVTYAVAATVYDLEAPPGTLRNYRARGWTSSAPTSYSSYVTASATAAPTTWWLRDVADATSTAIKVAKGSVTTTRNEQLTVHLPLGRPLPVVVGDVVRGEDFALTIIATSSSEYSAVNTLLLRQSTLLLRSPTSQHWLRRTSAVAWKKTQSKSGTNTAGYRRETAVTLTNVDTP